MFKKLAVLVALLIVGVLGVIGMADGYCDKIDEEPHQDNCQCSEDTDGQWCEAMFAIQCGSSKECRPCPGDSCMGYVVWTAFCDGGECTYRDKDAWFDNGECCSRSDPGFGAQCNNFNLILECYSPVTGERITDACISITLVDPNTSPQNIVLCDVFPFDELEGRYMYELPPYLVPGEYDVYIGLTELNGGRSIKFTISPGA